jgi:hypothetical protein
MKAAFLTLIFALVISSPTSSVALAQADQSAPEAVAKAYVDATVAADWAKAASLMHPDSLAELRKLIEPIFANEKVFAGEKAAVAAEMFFGVKSRAEFDQLSDAQAFEKLLGGLMGRIGGAMPGLDNLLSKASFDIIGQVAEAPDLVHLLYRSKAPLDDIQIKDAPALTKNVTITSLEVMTLKRYENTWRLTLSSELEGMAQMFGNIFATAIAAPPDEGKVAPRKAPSKPAKARKPARKP